jgi:hypothetical protein
VSDSETVAVTTWAGVNIAINPKTGLFVARLDDDVDLTHPTLEAMKDAIDRFFAKRVVTKKRAIRLPVVGVLERDPERWSRREPDDPKGLVGTFFATTITGFSRTNGEPTYDPKPPSGYRFETGGGWRDTPNFVVDTPENRARVTRLRQAEAAFEAAKEAVVYVPKIRGKIEAEAYEGTIAPIEAFVAQQLDEASAATAIPTVAEPN